MSFLSGSVQLKFALTYIALIVALLLLLNTYPLLVSRNLVFTAKHTALIGQAAGISQTLGGGERLERELVEWELGLLDIRNLTRLIVTDAEGRILYDTGYGGAQMAELDLYPGLSAVFSGASGSEVWFSEYSGGSFYSWAACPILGGETVIGAVFLHEDDAVQGALIVGIQRNLLNISILTFVIALFLAVVFSRRLTKRLKEILSAMRIVGRGDYGYKLDVRGRDELAELGQAFNNLTGRLEETEEMRRRFVSDASHELKTPLASIQLLSDSIVQSADMDEGTIREFVEDIGQEAERLGRTTEKLLRLTRLDVAPETALVPVDIARVVESAEHMLRPLARRQNVEMTLDLAPDCLVLATEDDVYQIVFNLAENGIKYNVAGGTLHIRLDKENPHEVRLIVEDTGIGIPAVDIPHIFDRFYRVDKARASGEGGSGLGLSIVRDTVRQHGGQVEVAARPAGGVRVTVVFPRAVSN